MWTRVLRSLIATSFFALPGCTRANAQATPAPAATPPVAISGALTGFTFYSDNPNAAGALDTPNGTDRSSRTQIGSALLTVARSGGTFRFNVTAGAYAFPVVGQAINPTFQAGANTNLYGYLPNAYIQYVPNGDWTFSAGILPTLLGQENAFTVQNINIQRGLVWNAEPVVSRGIRATYAHGTLTASLEVNDGFYSQSHRALEGLLGWAPSSSSNLQFAIILPDPNTPGNKTAAVANKREYDLMYTQQVGKLQLLPYALLVQSPASTPLGYGQTETAFGAVLMADYAFNNAFSLGGRFEAIANSSLPGDAGLNADFLGYGSGSSATTFTLTPTFKSSHWLARAEWSQVRAYDFAPGLGFGAAGASSTQTRAGIEIGAQF